MGENLQNIECSDDGSRKSRWSHFLVPQRRCLLSCLFMYTTHQENKINVVEKLNAQKKNYPVYPYPDYKGKNLFWEVSNWEDYKEFLI